MSSRQFSPFTTFHSAARRHIRLLGIVLSVTLVVFFVVNTLVDPLRMNRWPWKLRALEPYREISGEMRTGKVGIVLSRDDWQVAMVGSSRIAHAFDPLLPEWGATPAVNLGLAGGFLYETVAMARFAAAHASIRTLIIGIDPGDLSSPYDSRVRSDFYASPLVESSAQDNLNLALRHHFGVSAFEKSIQTLLDAARGQPARYTPEGMRARRAKDEKGDQFSFIRRGLARPDTITLPPPSVGLSINPAKLHLLEQAVFEFRRKGIKVIIVYLPRHALNYATSEPADNTAPFAHERRALVELIGMSTPSDATTPSIEVWDFNGFRDIDCEPLPATPGARMSHWNDLDHYTSEVGGMILARVMGWPIPESVLYGNYGDRLSSETIETHMEAVHARHRRYLQESGIADIALKQSLAP